jgi:hypothetical protein
VIGALALAHFSISWVSVSFVARFYDARHTGPAPDWLPVAIRLRALGDPLGSACFNEVRWLDYHFGPAATMTQAANHCILAFAVNSFVWAVLLVMVWPLARAVLRWWRSR